MTRSKGQKRPHAPSNPRKAPVRHLTAPQCRRRALVALRAVRGDGYNVESMETLSEALRLIAYGIKIYRP